MSEKGDFYEDDDLIAAARDEWRSGERGVTFGTRDLDQRARAAVDRVIAGWDSDDDHSDMAAGIELAVDAGSLSIAGAHLAPTGVSFAHSTSVTVTR